VDLSVDLAPTRPGALVLRTPVLAAAGAFGYGLEYVGIVDFDELGAICTRGTTLKPRSGNPPPRMTETPAGLLNAIGLQNPGIDAVLERYAARWAGWPVPVIVNVGAESAEDFVALARKLDGQPGVAAIELNLSCPNSARGGLQFALDPAAAGQITAAVRRATDLPLLVKLSPAALDVREIARAVEDAGADAITAVNTLPGLAMDRQMRAPLLRGAYGGLSGPALKPVALRVVYEVAQAVDIPIVAAGGVGSLEDVLDFLFAGACAVQVGTALFADSGLPVQLVDDLDGYCRELGHGTHRELVGVAQPSGRARSSVKSGEYRA
jgi:dihydroorotate dehydrogenase (NAD+) catalytic subunit